MHKNRSRNIFEIFERLINTRTPSPDGIPPTNIIKFFNFHLQSIRLLIAFLFISGLMVAILDAIIPVFIGKIIAITAAVKPEHLFEHINEEFIFMSLVILGLRPISTILHSLLVNQAINPGIVSLMRWRNHRQIVSQSWSFFQNDFAGRIANRVLQTGPAMIAMLISAVDAVWYILIFCISAFVILCHQNLWLAIPILFWLAGYVSILFYLIPKLTSASQTVSQAKSLLTGQLVDSYSNIMTVKLFNLEESENSSVREAIDKHNIALKSLTQLLTKMIGLLSVVNAMFLFGIATTSLQLWAKGYVNVTAIATALPLAFQCISVSTRIARMIFNFSENLGVVEDGMRSLAVPSQQSNQSDYIPLRITGGAIRFESVYFSYGSKRGLMQALDLDIQSGEHIGIVGTSGAGKSTLINLLLGLFEPDYGRITIDGQDITKVSPESLRNCIATVTQETALLNRSVRENIAYGQPDATQAEIEAVARQAQAHNFIIGLEDSHERYGYDAHIGERGTKLSGGQRQRIAIARALLKNAPILVLDEATSALDSETEAAIQEQLEALMQGRTCIAVAHRLSTVARMDRIAVLENGLVVEHGNHETLLARNGVYTRLWARQNRGFRKMATKSRSFFGKSIVAAWVNPARK